MACPRFAIALLIVALGHAAPRFAAATAAAPDAAPEAVFDWFDYQGDDPLDGVPAPGPGQFRNPVLQGFYPDPSVVRVGIDYYLVNSTFGWFPGIPVFHSRDLVHWTQLGNAIDWPGQLDFGHHDLVNGVFAPAIAFHDGRYYIANTCFPSCGGNYVITATDPAGPWSDPVWLPELRGGIDPSLFFDDDGRAWIVNNDLPEGGERWTGHRAIWLQEFGAKTLRTIGPRTVILDGGVDPAAKPEYVEGPHLFKKDGWYYLTAAEGGTGEMHSQVILRSRQVRGPYVAWARNPILTQRDLPRGRANPVTSTGHADFVQAPDGQWWVVFLGNRPLPDDSTPTPGHYVTTGRETFLLPVRWEDGWPRILEPGQTVPRVLDAPMLPAGGMKGGQQIPESGAVTRDGTTPRTSVASGQSATIGADAGSIAEPVPAAHVGGDAASAADRLPTSGAFALRDEFDGPRLPPYWMTVRNPRQAWYRLEGGALHLQAREVGLGERDNPSFLARRQQHQHALATTVVRFAPERDGDSAGLVAFQNEDYWYRLALARVAGRLQVVLDRRDGREHREPADSTRLAAAPLPATAAGRPLYLRIRARGARYDFEYAVREGEWRVLAHDVDGTLLSTAVAGGFTGAVFGMYAGRAAQPL